MSGFGKAITAILGIVAVLACLSTIGIIGYTALHGGFSKDNAVAAAFPQDETVPNDVSPVPTETPIIDSNTDLVPQSVDPNHFHNYVESVVKPATCMEAGQLKYTCSCGDSYYVDILAKGHIPDEWEVVKKPTDTEDGYKVQKCIYCDEVIAKETLPATGSSKDSPSSTGLLNPDGTPHEHLYVATVDREPTCTFAGLRKLTCSCGNFYTESIPAIGHVAADWEEAQAPTTDSSGTEQRMCVVCGAMLDTRYLPALSPSPTASASPSAGSGTSPAPASSSSPGATTAPSATPAPTPTPHEHKYTSYVVTRPTCTEKGIRSYVCSCGSSYAETIDLDPNNHKFQATFVAPTNTQQGYTIYTCVRCNYSYKDNYIMPLSNEASSEEDNSNQ